MSTIKPNNLLHPTANGLYCPVGDFYIDPVRPVTRALVTHGHADHARPGHESVLATDQTVKIMDIRYGQGHSPAKQTAQWGDVISINGVDVSFHPAGHVLGSAQIAVEYKGLRIVFTGDYKTKPDPTCQAYEPVPCHVFITEATFGLPVLTHPEPMAEIRKLLTSVEQFPERTHLVGAYALGKAQRVIRLIRDGGYHKPIYLHGAMQKLCNFYQAEGIDLGELRPATLENGKKDDFAGKIVVAPPSTFGEKWARRFPDPLPAFCSGWMMVRQRAKQRGVELPLVISDHCDWPELTQTITELAPEQVWVTHGREEALVRWCELNYIAAEPLNLVGYDDESE